MTDLYKKAAQQKLRFDTCKGLASVEDLFSMPLVSNNSFNLDEVAKQVNRELKATEEESFVNTKPNGKQALAQLKLDVVKDVIETKKAAAKAAEDTQATAAERQRILALLDEKERDALASLSPEELRERLKALG